jgi:hypothetical protein
LEKNKLWVELSTSAVKGLGLVQWFPLCSFLYRKSARKKKMMK